jgi:hypothetical protein
VTWWQILLIFVSWGIVWGIGANAGYEAGWYAHERAVNRSAEGS